MPPFCMYGEAIPFGMYGEAIHSKGRKCENFDLVEIVLSLLYNSRVLGKLFCIPRTVLVDKTRRVKWVSTF